MQPASEESLLDAVKNLIAIESTANNPAGLSAAYDFMRSIILNCDKDITIEEFEANGKPSFLAYRGQSRPDKFHILLNAHVDVVPGKPEQYSAIIIDGKLYGRGVYDMKAAAIILAQIFCEYVDRTPYPLGLQIVTDEENSGMWGTKYQVDQGVRADFILCGECGRATGTCEIANEAKGVATLDIAFNGNSSHAAYPWRGENAALKGIDFLNRLHDLFPIPEQETGETTIAVTGIHAGGLSHNQTPEFTSINLDCRYAPGDPRFGSIEAITAFIHSIDPEATITQFVTYGPSMYTNPHNPLLLDLKAAAEEIEGSVFSLVRRNGTSDGRFYTNVGGEACEFGITGGNQHADNEYISLEAFHSYLETLRAFMHKTLVAESAYQRTLPTTG